MGVQYHQKKNSGYHRMTHELNMLCSAISVYFNNQNFLIYPNYVKQRFSNQNKIQPKTKHRS